MSGLFDPLLRFKVATVGGQISLSWLHINPVHERSSLGRSPNTVQYESSHSPKGICIWDSLRKGNGMLPSKDP